MSALQVNGENLNLKTKSAADLTEFFQRIVLINHTVIVLCGFFIFA